MYIIIVLYDVDEIDETDDVLLNLHTQIDIKIIEELDETDEHELMLKYSMMY